MKGKSLKQIARLIESPSNSLAPTNGLSLKSTDKTKDN